MRDLLQKRPEGAFAASIGHRMLLTRLLISIMHMGSPFRGRPQIVWQLVCTLTTAFFHLFSDETHPETFNRVEALPSTR